MHFTLFTWVLGIRTQDLMLPRQGLCQLSHLLSPFCLSLLMLQLLGKPISSSTSVVEGSEHPNFSPVEEVLHQAKLLSRAGCTRTWREAWNHLLTADVFMWLTLRPAEPVSTKAGNTAAVQYGTMVVGSLQAFDAVRRSSHWTQPSPSSPLW